MHIRGIRDIVVQEAILSKEPLIWHRAPVAGSINCQLSAGTYYRLHGTYMDIVGKSGFSVSGESDHCLEDS